MASDDKDKPLPSPDAHEFEWLRENLEKLRRHLEARDKLDRVLGTFLLRVGKGQLDPDDAAMRLQAAMEDRLVVAPIAERTKRMDDDEHYRLVAAAQRALGRGNLAEAIRMYEALVRGYPEDTRFRLKLGDCYARAGEVAKATEAYLAVAATHAKQGFFLKAVAVYKQVLTMSGRQPPEQRPPRKTITNVHHALAELFEHLNLRSEALVHLEECYRLTDESDGVTLGALRERIMRLGGNPQGPHD
jgi:tetratricopeptide (TPR) repeat protein